MKNLTFKPTLALLFLAITLLSCKKDIGKVAENANFFKLNSTTYDISNGYYAYTDLVYNGIPPFGYAFDLCFTSSSVKFDNTLKKVLGTGNFLHFLIGRSASTEIPSGTFPIVWSDQENFKIGECKEIEALLNYNFDESSGIIYHNDRNDSGTIIISKSGNIYDIKYDITLEGGEKHITGQFIGELQFYPLYKP